MHKKPPHTNNLYEKIIIQTILIKNHYTNNFMNFCSHQSKSISTKEKYTINVCIPKLL